MNKYRGECLNLNKTVYGDLITVQDTHRIREYSRFTSNEYLVDSNTISQYTGLGDTNCKDIFNNDKVDFLGMKGEICFECGAFGIGFVDSIDYDLIQKEMDSRHWCCGNEYSGIFNDNFISLWEIYWNFKCEEGAVDVVEILEENNNG